MHQSHQFHQPTHHLHDAFSEPEQIEGSPSLRFGGVLRNTVAPERASKATPTTSSQFLHASAASPSSLPPPPPPPNSAPSPWSPPTHERGSLSDANGWWLSVQRFPRGVHVCILICLPTSSIFFFFLLPRCIGGRENNEQSSCRCNIQRFCNEFCCFVKLSLCCFPLVPRMLINSHISSWLTVLTNARWINSLWIPWWAWGRKRWLLVDDFVCSHEQLV